MDRRARKRRRRADADAAAAADADAAAADADAAAADAAAAALSTPALRVELRRRALSTTGLRPQLAARLREALRSQPHLSVPPRLPALPLPFARAAAEQHHQHDHHAPLPALLRHRCVWLVSDALVAAAWRRAAAGKGALSRSAPSYHALAHAAHANWRGRAMRQLLALQQLCADDDHHHHDHDRDRDRADVEHLQLTLPEAFYLAFVTRQIAIIPDTPANASRAALTDRAAAWRLFCARCARFPLLFVAYARYRAAGWLPKSGLKYGVHWVLYPTKRYPHTHAPYCVLLHLPSDNNSADHDQARLQPSWIALQNRLRLVNNVAKTLLIARLHVAHPVHFAASISRTFAAVTITEFTVDRWLP